MPMEILKTVQIMQKKAHEFIRQGLKIGLVPTMGFLHEGHIELMRVARKETDKLIVSIFVNPAQFGPDEDFDKYPRDSEGDIKKAQLAGVDVLFMPTANEMYQGDYQTTVHLDKVTRGLCAISRPGHFDGVTTVVAKLFNITMPHTAVFGRKDYQQLAVISRMVKDLNMDIRIIGVDTVREPDGLAMSSRNKYLNPDERKSALCLKKSLDLANRMFEKGERDAALIKQAVNDLIKEYPFTRIEYINLCHPSTLEDINTLGDETILALAVHVGKTRLIDNCLIK